MLDLDIPLKRRVFSTEMLRAIDAGIKTETRRVDNSREPIDSFKTPFDAPCSTDSCFWYRVCDKEGKEYWGITRDWETIDGSFQICSPREWHTPGSTFYLCETTKLESFDEQDRIVRCFGFSGIPYLVQLTPDEWKKFKSRQRPDRPTPARYMYRSCARLFTELQEVRVEPLQDITEEGAIAEGVKSRDEFRELWDKLNGHRAHWDNNPLVRVEKFQPLKSRGGLWLKPKT